jgi:hypothetical protein
MYQLFWGANVEPRPPSTAKKILRRRPRVVDDGAVAKLTRRRVHDSGHVVTCRADGKMVAIRLLVRVHRVVRELLDVQPDAKLARR